MKKIIFIGLVLISTISFSKNNRNKRGFNRIVKNSKEYKNLSEKNKKSFYL